MPRRIIFVSVAVTAIALSTTAGGLALFGAEESSPTAYSAETASTAAPIAPGAAITSSLARLNDTEIASAAFVSPPPGADARGLPWLRVLVHVTAMRDGLDIRPQWMADLLQGGVLELSGAGQNQRETLGGATFDALLPGGRVVADIGGGIGDVVRGQKFSLASNADAAADVAAALKRNGLEPVSVKIRRVLGPAPEVIAFSPDVGAALRARYKQIVAAASSARRRCTRGTTSNSAMLAGRRPCAPRRRS